MIALITQRHMPDKYGCMTDSLENSYIEFFTGLGFTLIPVSNSQDNIEKYFFEIKPDAVILSGGGSVDAELFGEKNADASSISKKRDALEKKLIDISISENIPVFGICRGMQFINVYFGGKLNCDIRLIDHNNIHTPGKLHALSIIESVINKKFSIEKLYVNTYHNHGITNDLIGEGLIPFAIEPVTGLIEGVVHRNYRIAGFQWHPERKSESSDFDKEFINSFFRGDILK